MEEYSIRSANTIVCHTKGNINLFASGLHGGAVPQRCFVQVISGD